MQARCCSNLDARLHLLSTWGLPCCTVQAPPPAKLVFPTRPPIRPHPRTNSPQPPALAALLCADPLRDGPAAPGCSPSLEMLPAPGYPREGPPTVGPIHCWLPYIVNSLDPTAGGLSDDVASGSARTLALD
jgi:hypothetical protein